MMKRARTFRCCRTPGRFALATALLLVISACATRAPAPIEDRSIPPAQAKRSAPASPAVKPAPAHPAESEAPPQTYTVKRGDTLHLIALDHGLDYRELAAWNGIQNVDVIRVGQVLRLSPPGDTVASTTTTTGAGVTTAPLKSAAPIVAGSAAPPSAPNGGASPGANPAQAAAAAPTVPASERASAPVVTGRNSDTYKTQPKAAKEPYSERALREMQQRFQASTTVAANASAPAGPAGSSVTSSAAPASSSPEATMPATSAPSQPATPASPPQTIARADTKLESKPPAAPLNDEDDDKLEWTWPTAGKLVTGFSDTANLKGIDIAGKTGQPVLASAAGKVVYAGSGLRGYGKLIIIKHNKNYLSAYAHNKDILVKEGQQVTRGQKIAEMGNTDADQVKLHFEIRRLGKPMDPLKYLPPVS